MQKIYKCMALLLVIAFLAGCTPTTETVTPQDSPQPVETEAPTVEEPPAVQLNMKPGTYTAQGYGFSGYLTVSVTLTQDAITAIELVEHRDTEQQVIAPAKLVPERIIENQSLSIDTITGATATSSAMMVAIRDCIKQAGGDPAAFNKPIEKSTKTIEYTTDLVIIGAGATGCSTAMQAQELGVNTILLEKAAKLGGTSAHASGPMGVNPTKLVEAETETEEDANALFQYWFANSNGLFKGNIVRNFINLSGSTIDWLESHGFQFEMPNHFMSSPFQINNRYVGSKQLTLGFFESMVGDYEAKGGQVFLETNVDDLLYDSEGNITGVTATCQDGTTMLVYADAVMLATGGMGGNQQLQKELYGDTSYDIYGMHTNKGDGIRMALDNGAALYNVDLILCHTPAPAMVMTTQVDNDVDRNITFGIATGLNSIMRVNRKGERFMDEVTGGTAWQQGGYHWALLSKGMVDTLKEKGFAGMNCTSGGRYLGVMPDATLPLSNIESVLDIAIDMGFVFKANSIEELAKQCGMEPDILKRNFDRYEADCVAGIDTYYNKDAAYLIPYGGGPYYAVKCAPRLYTSAGGLDVDEDMCVLREDGTRIEGLYAGGAECMGVLFGASYLDLGGPALGFCFNSGRMAAHGVADQLGK